MKRILILFYNCQLLLLFDGFEQANAIDCGRCSCIKDPATGFQNIDCNGIPFADIKLTFGVNTGIENVNRFRVIPLNGDSQIPADLLGTNRVRVFNLTNCGSNVMKIDPNAFKASTTTTLDFFIIDCNVGNLTWLFLKGFNSLKQLQLVRATNIQSLRTLPSLPSLTQLSITSSKGFDSLNFPGSSLGGLKNLIMAENVELNDTKVESILATLTTANGLEMLSLKSNPFVRRVPSDTLANFSALHSLDLSLCNIDLIDSLSFSAPVVKVDLTRIYLSDISDNSFENGISIVFLSELKKSFLTFYTICLSRLLRQREGFTRRQPVDRIQFDRLQENPGRNGNFPNWHTRQSLH